MMRTVCTHPGRIVRIGLAFAVASWAVVALPVGRADEKTPPKADAKTPASQATVMQRKLVQAQKFLEGVAMNDFDKVNKATAELVKLRSEAGWNVVKTRRYVTLSDDFQGHLE